jgi:hypothetical protein
MARDRSLVAKSNIGDPPSEVPHVRQPISGPTSASMSAFDPKRTLTRHAMRIFITVDVPGVVL